MITYEELKELFLKANELFLIEDKDLFDIEISERSLYGALMIHLNRLMIMHKDLRGYYTDVEYNKHRGNIEIANKTIKGPESQIINVYYSQ